VLGSGILASIPDAEVLPLRVTLPAQGWRNLRANTPAHAACSRRPPHRLPHLAAASDAAAGRGSADGHGLPHFLCGEWGAEGCLQATRDLLAWAGKGGDCDTVAS
jgi:hypothetical protein